MNLKEKFFNAEKIVGLMEMSLNLLFMNLVECEGDCRLLLS